MSTLFTSPFVIQRIQLPEIFKNSVLQKNYRELEKAFQEALLPQGVINQLLREYCHFSSVEGIIAIRNAMEDEVRHHFLFYAI